LSSPPHPDPPSAPPAPENPPWTGWDVLALAFLTIVCIFVFLFTETLLVQRLLYPAASLQEVGDFPLVKVGAQFLAYLALLIIMVILVKRGHRPFWRTLRWNWPQNWSAYLFAGLVLALGLQGLAHFLPMPRQLPIDQFFQTAREAWALSLFGVTLAPLLEELFFRGFLYPVLVRRVGIGLAIILTSLGFGLIHAPQLGRAWAPVLVVFLVGLALTITRAVTKSVARSLLIHAAYNGTISVLLFIASDGFRHLEKLNQ